MADANKAKSEKKRKDPDRRARIKFLVTAAISAVFVLTVALVAYFFPLRDRLPAVELPAREEGETRVHFISVGEGDATLIEFSDGECLLIDGGDGSFSHAEKLIRYLRGVEIRTLSVLSTHSDADHCGGIGDVIKSFDVDTLYLPVIPAETGAYKRMLQAAEQREVEVKSFTRYDTIAAAGAYAVCLSPYSIGEEDENDASALIYLDAGGVKFLFGADISSTRERRLLREYEADSTIFDSGKYSVDLRGIDILRVSHHGSASSSSQAWLELLGAEVAVVSCGEDNRYAHPAEEAVGRLAAAGEAIYRLDELGDVIVSVFGGGYTVRTLA